MAAPASASRRAGVVSPGGAASRPTLDALASALPAKTDGDGRAMKKQTNGMWTANDIACI
jgi:hypothetical protein